MQNPEWLTTQNVWKLINIFQFCQTVKTSIIKSPIPTIKKARVTATYDQKDSEANF